MQFLKNLLAKLRGQDEFATYRHSRLKLDPALYDPDNKLYEVDLYRDDDYAKPFKTVAITAKNDIEAQFDALAIYGGDFALAAEAE